MIHDPQSKHTFFSLFRIYHRKSWSSWYGCLLKKRLLFYWNNFNHLLWQNLFVTFLCTLAAFCEKLYRQLEVTNERFEVKLMMMDLISRLIGLHKVSVKGWIRFCCCMLGVLYCLSNNSGVQMFFPDNNSFYDVYAYSVYLTSKHFSFFSYLKQLLLVDYFRIML